MVQGEIEVANAQLDDMVLLRADGTPTYMLSVVVDDIDMGITHVIRGHDHLTNTFRQVQLYRAIGAEPPRFAHIPLIHGADGAKLSKRHGALSVTEYREMGFLPEAVRNYLLRLGWSHGDEEIISTEQAIALFDLGAVGRSPARFDLAKLTSLNAHYLRERPDDDLVELIAAAPAASVHLARTTTGMRRLRAWDARAEAARPHAGRARRSRRPSMSGRGRSRSTRKARSCSTRRRGQPSPPSWRRSATRPNGARPRSRLSAASAPRRPGIGFGKLAQPLRVALTGGDGVAGRVRDHGACSAATRCSGGSTTRRQDAISQCGRAIEQRDAGLLEFARTHRLSANAASHQEGNA